MNNNLAKVRMSQTTFDDLKIFYQRSNGPKAPVLEANITAPTTSDVIVSISYPSDIKQKNTKWGEPVHGKRIPRQL